MPLCISHIIKPYSKITSYKLRKISVGSDLFLSVTLVTTQLFMAQLKLCLRLQIISHKFEIVMDL